MYIQSRIEIKEENFDKIVQPPQLDKNDRKKPLPSGIQIFPLVRLPLYFVQRCDGIAAWKYYPWVDWRDGGENKELRRVTYNKTRNDTILRVAFHSTLAQYHHGGCGVWYIKFSGR